MLLQQFILIDVLIILNRTEEGRKRIQKRISRKTSVLENNQKMVRIIEMKEEHQTERLCKKANRDLISSMKYLTQTLETGNLQQGHIKKKLSWGGGGGDTYVGVYASPDLCMCICMQEL